MTKIIIKSSTDPVYLVSKEAKDFLINEGYSPYLFFYDKDSVRYGGEKQYIFDMEDNHRTDPKCIKMVETLNTNLRVIEIPDNINWVIYKISDNENELVVEKGKIWGIE